MPASARLARPAAKEKRWFLHATRRATLYAGNARRGPTPNKEIALLAHLGPILAAPVRLPAPVAQLVLQVPTPRPRARQAATRASPAPPEHTQPH